MFFTCKISFPASLSDLKSIYGYFLFEGLISSNSIFSRDFFLDVACFDFEALALNLAIKSCNSLILSSFFLFLFLCSLIRYSIAALSSDAFICYSFFARSLLLPSAFHTAHGKASFFGLQSIPDFHFPGMLWLSAHF